MATLLKTRVFLLSLVITLMLVPSSDARLSCKLAVSKKFDNHHILRELGYDGSKIEYHRRRWMLGAAPERVSPGGPDPQHH